MNFSISFLRKAALVVLAASSLMSYAQSATFTVLSDAVRGGYIPELSRPSPVDPNQYLIGLDPSNRLSTGIFDQSRFSSSGVSADTIILNIKAPEGYIVSKIQILQSYTRTSSRGGTSYARTSSIVDDMPYVNPYGILDLTSQNKSEVKLALTSFLGANSGGVASASITMTSASIRVTLAPLLP